MLVPKDIRGVRVTIRMQSAGELPVRTAIIDIAPAFASDILAHPAVAGALAGLEAEQ
jgi:hypothetical protein